MTLKRKLLAMGQWLQRYPGIVASIVILGYYLTTTVDLFDRSGRKSLTFVDFFLHYDSLVWMWLVAFIFIKLQKTKERMHSEERDRLLMQLQIDKSRIASTLLKEITKQLQDSINNPLAVISVMTEDIRKRFIGEPDVMRRLDQIDVSLQRIHNAIKDVANYQTAKVLEALQIDMKDRVPAERSKEAAIEKSPSRVPKWKAVPSH
jgi:signal transduction histidine kinase